MPGAMSEMRIAVAQCCHPADGDVEALVRSYARRAAEVGAQLLVFPEFLMTPFQVGPEERARQAQGLQGPFSQMVRSVAAEFGLWVLYTVNERPDCEDEGEVVDSARACEQGASGSTQACEGGTSSASSFGGKPFNTAVLCNDAGEIRCVYRKALLFNAGPHPESDSMQAGDELCPVIETPFGALSVAICYDLRFPEVFRRAALRGCQLMLVPAGWVDGPGKDAQWRTLLAARAIEDQMFVVGACRADKGYVGNSCVVDPTGKVVASAGCGEELLVASVDLSSVERLRESFPVLQHRRPELYE